MAASPIDFERPKEDTLAAWLEACRYQFAAQAGTDSWAKAASAWALVARLSEGEKDRQVFAWMAVRAARTAASQPPSQRSGLNQACVR